ncbi:MAG: trypsin-like serine protease [Candidatus Thalassarchaeaceae archaeon]|nr:trypsin-like serine protease [Candidatus Thalassarchaeaceae archaeon]
MTLSQDGNFVWDGTKWVPVQQYYPQHQQQISPTIPQHPAYSQQNIMYVQTQRKRNTKFWILLGGGIFAFFVVILLIVGAIIWALLLPHEFGYRLDVSSSTYEDLGANREPYLVSEGYPDFSTTVAISNFGSGVIIGDRWVLTAGHVVLDEEYGEEQAGAWVVSVGSDRDNPDSTYDVKAIHIHPGWRADHSNDGLEYGVDIALIELTSSIEGVIPAPWANYTELDDSHLDSLIYSSGFGDYSEILDDGNGDYSQRRAWKNTLDRLSDDLDPPVDYSHDDVWQGGWVVYDFDSPDGDYNSLADGKNSGGEFSYVGEGDSSSEALDLEGTSVPGDSGGPTYLKINGEWTVIGLTSHGSTDGYYGDLALNTRVSSHAGWICSVTGSELTGCE